jgi:hypothetical protein
MRITITKVKELQKRMAKGHQVEVSTVHSIPPAEIPLLADAPSLSTRSSADPPQYGDPREHKIVGAKGELKVRLRSKRRRLNTKSVTSLMENRLVR